MTSSQLRTLMKKHGWTQESLALKLYRSPRIIRYYLRDQWPIPKTVELAIRSLAVKERE